MINIDGLLALWVFILFMVGTPGPANLLIMSLGARVGFWPAMRFNLGLVTGKICLNVAMAFGLLLLLAEQPVIKEAFKYISAGFMIWLALRGWQAQPSSTISEKETAQHEDASRPAEKQAGAGYLSGVIVHPLNPKAWVMSVLAWTDFGPALGPEMVQLILIPLSFAVAQLVLHSLWCFAGVVMARSLQNSLLLTRALIILTVLVVIWAVATG